MKANPPLHKHKLKPRHWWIFLTLITLPSISVIHLFCIHFDTPKIALLLFGIVFATSLACYIQCARDKKKAQAGEWRITEAHLHLLELLGGWPGGFLAQKRFRHKTRHVAYQTVFWAIVSLHLIVSIEYLFNGPISSALVQGISNLLFS